MTDLVMIYSNDPDFYMFMSHILAKAGFRASPAEDFDSVADARTMALVAVLADTSDDLHGLMTFCKRLKADPSTTDLPILALIRARHEQIYLSLIKAGIDEAFVRPVSPERILSYLRAISPLPSNSDMPAILPPSLRCFGDIEVDEQRRLIKCNKGYVQLSPIEFRLLKRLFDTPGQVLSRDELIGQAWPSSHHVNARTVDVHIAKLRRALEKTTGRPIIRTIRSNGYVADIVNDNADPIIFPKS